MIQRVMFTVIALVAVLIGSINASAIHFSHYRIRRATSTNVDVTTKPESELEGKLSMEVLWEQTLIVSPSTVNLLGHLTILSSKLDFSYHDFSANKEYKYMRRPESFRGTVAQIQNDAYDAFITAQHNMDAIRDQMEDLPRQVNRLIRFIPRAHVSRLTRRLMPKAVAGIEKSANDCAMYANGTRDAFINVQKLLAEIIEATASAQGVQSQRITLNQMELNITRALQAGVTQQLERSQKQYDEVKQVVRDAQKAFHKALDDIPTGWKAVGLELGRALVSVVRAVPSMLSFGLGFGGGSTSDGNAGGGGTQGSGNFDGAQRRTGPNSQAFSVGKILWGAIGIFKGKQPENGRLDAGAKKTFEMMCNTALGVLKAVRGSNAKAQVEELINQALELINKTKNNNAEGFKEEMQGIEDNVKKFVAADVVSGGRDDRPLQQHANSEGAVNSQDPSGDSSQNEKFIAQMSLQRLTNVEIRYDSIFSQLRQDQEQMTQLTARIASLDFKTINYQQLLDVMTEALGLIGKIRRQWDQLANFFQTIATHISGSLKNSMTDFVQPAFEMTRLDAGISREDGLDALEDMKVNALVVKEHASLLHFLAKSYVDVSRAYLTRPLAGLASLFAAKDDDERNRLKSELEQDTKISEGKIRVLVAQRKHAFHTLFQKRRDELQEKIEDLGGTDDKDTEAITDGLELVLV